MCASIPFRSKEIPFGSLSIDRKEIYLMMGSGGYEPDSDMMCRVETAIEHISVFCRPRFGFSVFDADEAVDDTISVGGRIFNTGKVITEVLRGAQCYAILVATSGTEFEQWYREEIGSGDILREFVASNVGSEIAEAVGGAAQKEIEEESLKLGLKAGNSYAPGYCGWPVSDQHSLFSLLPSHPCGISLNSSNLMIPIKSISGIIPLGSDVTKKAYGCAICDRRFGCMTSSKKYGINGNSLVSFLLSKMPMQKIFPNFGSWRRSVYITSYSKMVQSVKRNVS